MRPDTPELRPSLCDPLHAPAGSGAEVFRAFFKLGLTSFGGPIAHLGYIRDEIVLRRGWIHDEGYAELVALCQFLPGPTSSQVGYALGVLRAGPVGGLAAWCGFTLPSALFMTLAAFAVGAFAGPVGAGMIHGLKLAAVAIVAQAVWGMARALTPDAPRIVLALAAALIALLAPGVVGQILAIAFGAVAGLRLTGDAGQPDALRRLVVPVSWRAGVVALGVFALLLAGLPLAADVTGSHGVALLDVFFRSGALVFGGGHVVLPLLETAVTSPGWIDADVVLAGYGAAQAAPGPLFAFAAYLGAAMGPAPNGVPGAALALAAIFLPGLLLVTGALPFWNALRARPKARAAMRGANAAVVGVLAAALYHPVGTGAVVSAPDGAVALAGFVLLTVCRLQPWAVVALMAASGVVFALI